MLTFFAPLIWNKVELWVADFVLLHLMSEFVIFFF